MSKMDYTSDCLLFVFPLLFYHVTCSEQMNRSSVLIMNCAVVTVKSRCAQSLVFCLIKLVF